MTSGFDHQKPDGTWYPPQRAVPRPQHGARSVDPRDKPKPAPPKPR